MSTGRKILLILLLVLTLTVIVLTWGSIGSSALTLALLISVLFLALKKSLERDPRDFDWEE